MKQKGSTRWYKHCKDTTALQNFTLTLSESRIVLGVLKKLIEEDLKTSQREKVSKDAYENASWPYMQADKNGEARAYNKILNLIKDFA